MKTQAEAMEAHNAQVTLYRAARQEIADTLRGAVEAHASGVMVSVVALTGIAEMLTNYEDGITWQTTCTHCASLMNQNYAQYEQIDSQAKVIDAAQGVINCIDDDDLITIHDNGGGSCLHELRAALKKLAKVKR